MNMHESIRYYREKAGMRQLDLGQRLGVSAQAVSKWELGKAEPDRECIEKMCQIFGINSDSLLGIDHISFTKVTNSLHQPGPSSAAALTPDEHSLLSAYRSLNEDGRTFIRAAVTSASSNPAYQKDGSGKAI